MEPTQVRVRIRKYKESQQVAEENLVLDTGMPFAIVPGKTLRDLGVVPDGEETFFVGTDSIVRKRGDAYFEIGDHSGYSKVIFGEEGDMRKIGPKALAGLGLMLNPFTGELRPLTIHACS